ncbi:MAG: hypothetical protein ACRC54_08655 [Fusobacteriaceae bacterium]
MIETLKKYILDKNLKGIELYYSKFQGYAGDYPTLKVYDKEKREIVFGNKNPEEAIEILEKYYK